MFTVWTDGRPISVKRDTNWLTGNSWFLTNAHSSLKQSMSDLGVSALQSHAISGCHLTHQPCGNSMNNVVLIVVTEVRTSLDELIASSQLVRLELKNKPGF